MDPLTVRKTVTYQLQCCLLLSRRQHWRVSCGGAGTDLSPHVGIGSVATNIYNAGQVIGWSWNAQSAFIFDSVANVVAAEIPPLPKNTRAVATVISQTGDVVGVSGDTHGFVYSGGTLRDLGPAGVAVGFVEDISEQGQVCGSISKPWPQTFSPGIWDISQTVPSFTEILVPAGFLGAHASGINNKGDVVGTCWTPQTADGDQTAYIYSGGVSTDLNTLIPAGSGWRLQFADAINDDGQITGTGHMNGQQRGFILTPVPQGTPYSRWDMVPLPMLVAILLLGGVTVGGPCRGDSARRATCAGRPVGKGPGHLASCET